MQAWMLDPVSHSLDLVELPSPTPRPGTVVVRMGAVPLLSYLGDYVAGRLPYRYPDRPFTPGTNGVGRIDAVGPGVYHLRPGQRVLVSPHLAAGENVPEPARILMGLTGMSADSAPMLADWPDGTLRQQIELPAGAATPLDGLDHLDDGRLAALAKFTVPLGGLVRGRLAVAETLVVNGATGYFGSAAVLLGVALGAARVVAAGRNRAALDAVVARGGPRVAAVALTGDIAADAAALRDAAGGGADLAFDIVGRAGDARATQSALRALRRGGRLVLMGSMAVPLPLDIGDMLANNWEVIGHFMYRPADLRRLVDLVRMGTLDLSAVTLRRRALGDLRAAMVAAADMKGLDCIVVMPELLRQADIPVVDARHTNA